ncbi:MAG: DUF3127 domain-containing protein [Bacteroidales bacterium]|nr:DUF3127 domain-containing protein [Bacteroidales bacterium]
MEIIGKVLQLGTLTEGNSPRGPWKKQELIIETLEQFPKKVCLTCWGDRVNDANSFFVGQTIKAQIRIESREFNGKWYTDVTAFRLDLDQPVAQQPLGQMQQPNQMQQQPLPPMPPANDEYFASDNGDDLPF